MRVMACVSAHAHMKMTHIRCFRVLSATERNRPKTMYSKTTTRARKKHACVAFRKHDTHAFCFRAEFLFSQEKEHTPSSNKGGDANQAIKVGDASNNPQPMKQCLFETTPVSVYPSNNTQAIKQCVSLSIKQCLSLFVIKQCVSLCMQVTIHKQPSNVYDFT